MAEDALFYAAKTFQWIDFITSVVVSSMNTILA